MNLEQAAEQILRGAFRDCKGCDGTGYSSHMQIHDEISMETCGICEGKGQRYRVRYLKACKKLGMEPKPIPANPDYLGYDPKSGLTLIEAVNALRKEQNVLQGFRTTAVMDQNWVIDRNWVKKP